MASDHITDAMVDEALVARHKIIEARFPEAARWPDDYDEDEQQFQRDTERAILIAAERAAWQSIETAPRDGTRVQLLAGGDQFIAGWMTAIEDGSGDWIIYRRLGFDGQEPIAVRCLGPDKWRPLPPPEPSHD